jgi:hypothetical protein
MARIELAERRPAEATAAVGSDRLTGRIAVLGGAVGLVSVASLGAFFIVGGPFGAINDWTIGIFGFLTGLLAVGLGGQDATTRSPAGTVPIGLAVVGAGIVVVGSYLVISDATGFLRAGLVESGGFALIGVWLIVLNRSMAGATRWPRRLPGLGIVAGLVMAIGFVVIPGIAMGLDEMDAAPAWVWLGFLGWLGIFFLYPVWSVWFGIGLLKEGTGQAIEDL